MTTKRRSAAVGNEKTATVTKKVQGEKKEMDAIAAKHNQKVIYCIEVLREDGSIAKAYFKKPDRNVYGSALSMQARNPLAAKEIILRSTFLEGDQDIIENDDLFFSACTVVDEMLTINMATLKKN